MSWDGVERTKAEMHAIIDKQWKTMVDACTDPMYAIGLLKLWRAEKQAIDAGIMRV